MPNQFINPQPNYSGVTIQINNPAVNVRPVQDPSGGYSDSAIINQGNYTTSPQNCCYPNVYYPSQEKNPQHVAAENDLVTNPNSDRHASYDDKNSENTKINTEKNAQYSYPAEYYLNNYNRTADERTHIQENTSNTLTENYIDKEQKNIEESRGNRINKDFAESNSHVANNYDPSAYRVYENTERKDTDTSTSKGIIDELSQREAAIQEEKKNSKEVRVVALTDEYIKSLENYLNNPNDEIRLMASKEILTRLDEDKDRYDDAALNALLNKMLQDPSKLIRIAALSAFASQLASGNDYTVKLLNDIQSNPNADKEDVLQAADILLKMSSGTEIKNIPNPKIKEEPEQTK